jgi:hypothetical protein
MSQSEKAVVWAKKNLLRAGQTNVLSQSMIADTSYSTVYKFVTTNGIFYLKIVPKELFMECDMLDMFYKLNIDSTPKCLAKNAELNAFLMPSCGNITLRKMFDGKIDLALIKKGIAQFTKIQRSFEGHVNSLLSMGAPDWRLEKFQNSYERLIQNKELLLSDGLTPNEIKQLQSLQTKHRDLCEELSNYNIPDTINHGDFHENNIILDQETSKVTIIDWGEVTISHPFFSLNGCLWNLVHFNDLKEGSEKYNELKLNCVSPWLDLYDEATLLRLLSVANQLNGVFAALTYEQLYLITKDKNNGVQHQHPGSIAGCLRTFIASVSAHKS